MDEFFVFGALFGESFVEELFAGLGVGKFFAFGEFLVAGRDAGIELQQFVQKAFVSFAKVKNQFAIVGAHEFHPLFPVAFHGGMEAVFLKLMDVVLGLFHALAGEDALALFVDLQHVELGFLAIPTEHGLEDVRDVAHVVDGVVPADDEIAGLEGGIRFVFGLFNFSWQQFGRGGLGHAGKLKDGEGFVERTEFTRRGREFLRKPGKEECRNSWIPHFLVFLFFRIASFSDFA